MNINIVISIILGYILGYLFKESCLQTNTFIN
jgi:hypothetical protein